jgi:hypothetical protein
MARSLTQLLETVEVGEPQEAGGLGVFGVRWASAGGLEYTTLDEALAAGKLEVTEVSEGGSVPILKVANKGDTMVLLMAGEQLVGAKQNRILNSDIMAAARSELPIPVSCVEQGRWHYRSPKFGSGGMSHSALRYMMAKDTHGSYRAAGVPLSDQGKVWGEVARKLVRMKSASPTQALDQVYLDHCKRLEDVLQAFRLPQGCNGVAFAASGKVVGADLFDKPETLAKYWSKLVRAYALDALEHAPGAAVPADAVARWLRSGSRAKEEPFKSPGVGQDVRLESTDLIGAGLVVEDQPVHVEVFLNEATQTEV